MRRLHSRPWSDRFHHAIKESRLAWLDWRKSGSPKYSRPIIKCGTHTVRMHFKSYEQQARLIRHDARHSDAFDVVDQNSLLRKLYLDDIHRDDWLLLKFMYSDCSSRIIWAGELSHPINIRQGVMQGCVLSTGHYKRYNNPLLLQLEDRYLGANIGSISIPHVTVADDLALIAEDKSYAQVMVWDADNSA